MKFYIPQLIKLSLLFLLLQSCATVNAKYSVEKVNKHIIPVNNAIEMYNEHDSKRIQLFEDKLKQVYQNPNFEDTKFVWMPLDELKAYVSYIEAIKKTNPEDEVSGIRLYFSAYPNRDRLNDRTIKYPGQQTIFMVPTVKSNNRNERYNVMNHLPFIIKPESSSNPIKGTFVILEKLMLSYYKGQERVENYYKNSKQVRQQDSTSSGFSSRTATNQNVGFTSTVYNEGELAPPPKKDEQ